MFPFPLPAPRRSRYTELGVLPDTTAEEIRVATARHVKGLKESGATEEELAEANALNLTGAEQRASHDERHPPCALLRLRPTWSPVFEDREVALTVLRRDLEQFLTDMGSSVHPMSDLDRTDFSGDFRPSALLDGTRSETLS